MLSRPRLVFQLTSKSFQKRLSQQARQYATPASSSSTTTSSSSLIVPLLGLNLILTSYLIYVSTLNSSNHTKLEESLDVGMDRIDECLNRIDLRNNETTGYFELVSKKVERLEALEKKK